MKFNNDLFPESLKKDMSVEKYKSCMDRRSDFFIQYTCEQSFEEAGEKYKMLTIVATLVIFSASFYQLSIFYLVRQSKIDQKRYDLKTTTVGDYSIEMRIDKKMIAAFNKKEYRRGLKGKTTFEYENEGSPALGFKMALKKKFEEELLFYTEERMRELRNQGKFNDRDLQTFDKMKTMDEIKYNLSIASIRFAFDQGELIALLQKRGRKLAKHKWLDAQQVD